MGTNNKLYSSPNSWQRIENPLFQFEQIDEFAKFHFEYATKIPPPELFHYTSGDNLLLILESQYLIATERSFLNDPQEFQWGITTFKQHLTPKTSSSFSEAFIEQVQVALDEKLDDELRHFVFSFSADPDLLTQWRAYATEGQGFVLSFDGETIRNRAGFGEMTMQDINPDEMSEELVFFYHLLPVIYDRAEQSSSITRFLTAAFVYWNRNEEPRSTEFRTLFRLMLRHRAKELLISFKQPAYAAECEWRIVATVHKKSTKISYRNGRFGITPYIKLNISARKDLPASKLPITKIYIGPNSPAKKNARGLEMLCESKGLTTPLLYSNIDYRA